MENRGIVAGAILCGGKASRFDGKPKGLIILTDGQTIIERLIGEFEQVGIADPVLLTGDCLDYESLNKTMLPDRVADQGPLGGIAAALIHYKDTADAVLFATCDMPCLSANELTKLVGAFQESTAKIVYAETCSFGSHPLCSVVHIGMVDQVNEALDCGNLAVYRLWKELGAQPVSFANEKQFVNVNTPEDLSRLRGEPGEN